MSLAEHDLAELKHNITEFLDLSGKQLADKDIETICLTLPDLGMVKCLSLANNQLTSRGIELLEKFSSLTSLDLSKNPIDECGALTRLTTLQQLSLKSTSISSNSIRLLVQCPNLRSLNLNHCPLDITGLSALADSNLTTLSVTDAELGCAGAEHLARSKTLTDLNVAFNEIGNKGAQALAKNNHLLSLNLYYNEIDAQGAIELGKNSTLRELNIELNDIGDKGIEALAASRSLKTLYAGSDTITAQGAQTLFNNHLLTYLVLNSDELSATLQEKLKQHVTENIQRARRDNFVRTTLILVNELYKPNSTLYKLPADMLLHIFSFMPFSFIGKSRQQGYNFVQLVLNQYSIIKQSLTSKQPAALQFRERTSVKLTPWLSQEGLFKFSASEQLPSTWRTLGDEPPHKKPKLS